MDEKDLLIFLTLADTGNLTRTAEKLYLSQPTLSKRLQNMEADLGAALFLRSKQGVTLTPRRGGRTGSHPAHRPGAQHPAGAAADTQGHHLRHPAH